MSTLAESLHELDRFTRAQLLTRWAQVFGAPAPPYLHVGLLKRAIAWQLQARTSAKRFGVRDAHALRERLILKLERAGDLDRRKASGARRASAPRLAAKLAPGVRLLREWQGQRHEVEVLSGGFRYRGRAYTSLSAIAREITGARWSGPRFFGVRQ